MAPDGIRVKRAVDSSKLRRHDLFKKIPLGQCVSTRKGGLRLSSNLSCLDAAVLVPAAKLAR
jgi:hypothetical protein